jgi:diaminopimelate decarboxylase
MNKDLRIYVSGLYSGTNPQPGVGIARSLRSGYPDATLVGVEYSNRCSGIHWQDFDDIWLQRPWDELNLDSHAEEIKKVLDSGALWISSIDLEILWLASLFPDGHPNLLTPPDHALSEVSKPYIRAHRDLPVELPVFVTTDLSDWDLHAFCREHDWKVWLKGPYYEAVRTSDWSTLQYYRHVLTTAWATETLALQAHVSGYEESVMFCAYRGEILEAVRMQKRDLTELSKTWAGDSSEVPENIMQPLRKVVKDLNWTGGAELEMVRDPEDSLWLLEWNPRFPAWVHGSTITGRNLPAALVEAASGIPAIHQPAESNEFTRVVLEIPVKQAFPLSPLPEPLGGVIGHSMKHPSGLLQFAQMLHGPDTADADKIGGTDRDHIQQNETEIPHSFLTDLGKIDFSSLQTPTSLFLDSTAAEYFESAANLTRKLSNDHLRVDCGYSIKTNPDSRLLKLALNSGFYAEAISLAEAGKALETGFRNDQLILNGPAKWWRQDEYDITEFKAIFCDSIEELHRVSQDVASGKIKTNFLGVRLRTPNVPSRFGVSIDSPAVFQRLIEAVREIPRSCKFGVHFHMASSNIGVKRWWHLFESMLRWCNSVEALSGRLIECVDFGGGWFPDDLRKFGHSRLTDAVEAVPQFLSAVEQIITEPGKALAQPSMALATQILEVRKRDNDSFEAVVDGSIAELPMYAFQPHRVLGMDKESGNWRALGFGKSVLLGRLCMEHDIVASSIDLPENSQAGDILVFCDAGAYDRSMSYVFGVG